MRLLQLDVGNTRGKWRLLQNGKLLQRGVVDRTEHDAIPALLKVLGPLDAVWVASVAAQSLETELCDALRSRGITPWLPQTPARSGRLVNSYAEPRRLGLDRWLAMLAAMQRQDGPLCVVDAGSALTIDLVTADGCHSGGYIIPGPRLMESALLADTDRVRFEEPADYALTPGTSTAQAVRHGIAAAEAGALQLVLDRVAVGHSLVYTGGGGEPLQSLVGAGGTFVEDLVFEGLECLAQLEGLAVTPL